MSFIKNKHPTTYTELTDEEIVQQILQHPTREWQEVLYDRYVERIFHKCLHIVHHKDIAKDLTHDVWIKIFTKLDKYKGTSPFYGWIFAITYNHCMDYLKRQKKRKLTNYEEQQLEFADVGDIEREHRALKELRLQQLEQLLDQLTKAERLVLLMRYQDGLSIKQMATVLQISESATKMRLKRSRDHLANLLKKAADEQE